MSDWDFGDIDGFNDNSSNNNAANDIDNILSGKTNFHETAVSGA
jgi:hypothetical protein